MWCTVATLIKADEFINTLFMECKMTRAQELLINGKRWGGGYTKEGIYLSVVENNLVGRVRYIKSSHYRRKLGLTSHLNKMIKEVKDQLAKDHHHDTINITHTIKEIYNGVDVIFVLNCTHTHSDGYLSSEHLQSMHNIHNDFISIMKTKHLSY